MRIAVLAAAAVVAGCGESDADRAALAKDGDRVFHCEYRLDGPVSGRSINGSLDPCPSAR
jgi:hypothetical protein